MSVSTELKLEGGQWEQQHDNFLTAVTYIYGCPFHLEAVRVRYSGEHQLQEACPAEGFADDGLKYAQERADGCVCCSREVPGFPGEWVITMYPFGY